MNPAIEGLEPKRFWEYFAELSAIPRCSKNEAQAAAFVLQTAQRLGLSAQQDGAGNVVVRKGASAGSENVPVIALQSHLDMVCEKNSDSVHDFSKDPIILRRNGNFISADGTTLGADNGVGVCAALYLMESNTISHGPLEFLFTVDEETGLTGAAGLAPDFLKARTLINLDSEDDGVIYVGCAGGGDTVGTLPVSWEPPPARHAFAEVKISGLRGGHSGLEIHAGRANAVKLLTRALSFLSDLGAGLCSVDGGNKRNAIPREAQAVVALPLAQVDRARASIEELEKVFKSEFSSVDANVSLSFRILDNEKKQVLKKTVQNRLIYLLHALPHGVIAMSQEIHDLVETSTNLAMVKTGKKSVVIETSQRSSVDSEKKDIMQTVNAVFQLAGAKTEHGDGYPGWKPDLKSPILAAAKKTFQRMFGKEVQVKAVHAGLECGIIGEKFPGMDMISMGPTLEAVHSPEERVHIDTVKKFCDFLIGILESV